MVRLTLFVVGFALIGLATGTWLISRDAPSTIVRQTTRALSETPSGGGLQPGGPVKTVVKHKQAGTVTTTTTQAGPEVVSTTTTGPSSDDRSAPVTLAWLIVGAVLVLAATFFKPALRAHAPRAERPAVEPGPADPETSEAPEEPVTMSGKSARPISVDTF
jgi:hypothetical protein